MAFGETIEPGEAEAFAALAAEIGAIQQNHRPAGAPVARGLHVKQHAGAVGELIVDADRTARFGVFAEVGKRWPVYVRFSNGSSRRQPDAAPDVRGFALKLVGVPGKKLIEGLEAELTQDFLFIDTPSIPFRNPNEFVAFVRAAKDGPAPLVPRLVGSFGFGRAFSILWGAVTAKKVTSYATHDFHTGAPIAFGPTAAKLGLFPEPGAEATPRGRGANGLGEDLAARLRVGPLRWSLRAQCYVDEATTPVEDTSRAWSGPWVELGTLVLPKQELASPRGEELSALVSRLSFDPWHASEEHRPLGAIMRARRVAYGTSVIARSAAPEPREPPALPA